MKIIRTLTVLFLLTIVITACQKEKSNVPPISGLKSSKTTNIKQGEPVDFILPNVPEDEPVTWSVSPSANTKFSQKVGSIATLLFFKKGVYNVTAVHINNTSSRIVNVGDSIYTGNTLNYATQVSLTGDQLTLTPSLSPIDSAEYLKITVVTKNKYNCLNSEIKSDNSYADNAYTINFKNVIIPNSGCTPGTQTSSTTILLYPYSNDGNYLLTMSLNGITYSGSFIKSKSTYIFTWPYSTGVIIRPLKITR